MDIYPAPRSTIRVAPMLHAAAFDVGGPRLVPTWSWSSVFSPELATRGSGAESEYEADGLAALIDLARADHFQHPLRERRRRDAQRRIVVLFRIPDFFEDLAFMVQFADLGDEALATFKGIVCDEWAVWHKAVARIRDGGDRYSYTQFEALSKRMDEVPDW